MIVEPTNFMPRFFKSFEMASDRGEVARGMPLSSQGRGGRPALHQRFAVGPLPKVAIEAAKLLPDGGKHSGVAHGRRNFAPVADDAGVGVQRGLPGLIVGGDFVPIEIVERPAESLLLVQHALPRKPGLEAL